MMATTADTVLPEPAGAREARSFWSATQTIRSWLLTRDHKRVGIMFLGGTSLALLLGGVFAMLVRLEHLTPDRTLMDSMTYNRMFTLHGVIMVWLFMIPAIPSGFGNILLPLMIGAHDVAFPRLNLASFYVYLTGSVIVLASVIAGAIDTGWTFYVPYSTRSPTAVVSAVLGVFVVGISSIISGLNFIVTTHTLRAPGVGWLRMPFFVWTVYATSIIQVLATPVLGMVLLLVVGDSVLGLRMFDATAGGDPVLFQHLFWFYSHPAVYIMVLPALGVISEVVCTFSQNPVPSYRMIVFASLGIAFVGFLTWGHHMFTSGMSTFDAGVFGALSMFVAIFSAIKVFAWVGAMRGGSIRFTTPMVYVFAFLFLFVFGGMTGVAVATQSLDVHWHDTYFIVAHFHFIMVGAVITSFLAALHYWFPKVTGRLYSERSGLLAAALVFAGFFLTFFPQFLLGNAGMPRRYANYPPEFQVLHIVSTVGSWTLAAGLTITLIYLGIALFRGPKSGDNPWDSLSFEWRLPSPPPPQNFDDPPPSYEVGPYDYELVRGGDRE
jgi:cytochrome c oxidase subunit 1